MGKHTTPPLPTRLRLVLAVYPALFSFVPLILRLLPLSTEIFPYLPKSGAQSGPHSCLSTIVALVGEEISFKRLIVDVIAQG